MIKRGIVKFFMKDREKRWGFVCIINDAGERTGEEVFFHFTNGRYVDHTEEKPRFAGHTKREGRHQRPLRLPEDGEMLVLQVKQKARGPKADQWAYADDWDASSVPTEQQLVGSNG